MLRTLPASLQSLARIKLAIVLLFLGATWTPIVYGGSSPPAITSDDHTTFIANQFNSFEVTTLGNPTPTVSLTGSLPSGVNFIDNGNGTGTISGTPAIGAPGDYSSTIQACNSQSVLNGSETCVDQSFTLTVEEAPAFTSDDSVTFTVGQFNSFEVTTIGSPAPTLNWLDALPSGVNFVDNGDGTATLSGTADVGTFGDYPATIEACNVVDCADQSFTLTIQEAPSFTSSDNATFTVGVPGTFTVTTTGTTPISLSVSFGSLPADVQFVDNGDGTATISGTPQSGTDGPYPLSLQACNSVDCTTSSFTLTVDPAATPTCVPPPAGMISWWPGDGNANDIRGLNDGTPQGDATFAAGKVDQAFSFDGNGDYVDVGDVDLPGTFTIDAWINPDSLPAPQTAIIEKHGTFTSYRLTVFNDGSLEGYVSDGVQAVIYRTAPGTIVTGAWQHVAMTYDVAGSAGARILLYVHGANVATTASSDNAVTPGNEASSALIGSGVGDFDGLIDEVELFNRVLCADDILAIYNAGSAGKCKPLLNVDFNSDNPGPSFSATQTGFIAFDVADSTSNNWPLAVTGLDLATAPTGNATLTVQAPSPIASRDRTATPPNSGAFNFSDLYRDVLAVAGGPFTISLTGLAPNTIFDVTFYATDQGGSSSNTVTFANTTNGGSVPSGSITYGPPVASNHQFSVRLRVISNASGALTFSETSSGPQGGPVLNGLQVAPVPTANACPSPTPAALQLLNISARASVGTGDNVAIGGFIIQNDAAGPVQQSSPSHLSGTTKRVLVRGLGPSLAVGGVPVPGRLLDPVLEVYDENGVLIASNDNWRVPSQNETDVQATGLAPSDDLESALALTLNANANLNLYTAVLRGAGNTTGIGLIEIYDLEPNTATHLANISTRAQVLTGPDVLIGGIIVGGGNTQMLMVRALGPSLQVNGIPIAGRLADPYLELHDAQGTLIAHNDNWKEEPDGTLNATREAQIVATGLPPDNEKEAAILYVAPPPGLYTAIVRGVGGTGVGLVEVYRLGPPP